MASVEEFLAGLFASLGPGGALLALFVIFVVDATVFPLLPEVFLLLTYSFRPAGVDPFLWAALLLSMAVGGEAVGNATLYAVVRHALVRRGRLPKSMERLMRRWIDFLIVRDERIILVNRIAPVVPFVGAFIAACRWNVRKSLAYVVLGAAAKYSFLLVVTLSVGLAYDVTTARWITVALVVAVVSVSAAASLVYRRRAGVPPRAPKA